MDNGGETGEQWRFFTFRTKQGSLGELQKIAVGARATGINYALWNPLPIKGSDFFEQMHVFEKSWTIFASRLRVLITDYCKWQLQYLLSWQAFVAPANGNSPLARKG